VALGFVPKKKRQVAKETAPADPEATRLWLTTVPGLLHPEINIDGGAFKRSLSNLHHSLVLHSLQNRRSGRGGVPKEL
jgi:hypothetical protein